VRSDRWWPVPHAAGAHTPEMGPRGIVIGLSFAALCQAVQWRNVRIGGGGFVDGLVASRPGILANPSVYARTDGATACR